MFLISFYAVFLLLALAVPVMVFRALRTRGVFKALLASSFTLGLAVMAFPIPVHGGLTFPFEIMLQELKSDRSRSDQREVSAARARFVERLGRRFGGPLVIGDQQPAVGSWSSIVTSEGTRGWYDATSRLAWTDMLPLKPEGTPPTIESASTFCAQVEPRGYWALPTEAELSVFWKAGGYRLSPLNDYGTAGLLENVDFQTETLSLRLSRKGVYALRCVALGPGAPASGYLSGDIPLDEWNAYQLEKSRPGFPKP